MLEMLVDEDVGLRSTQHVLENCSNKLECIAKCMKSIFIYRMVQLFGTVPINNLDTRMDKKTTEKRATLMANSRVSDTLEELLDLKHYNTFSFKKAGPFNKNNIYVYKMVYLFLLLLFSTN